MGIQILKSQGTKAIVSVPGWVENGSMTTDRVGNTTQAYSYVPLIYRALQLRCDAIASVPVHIMRGDTEVEWPFPDVSLSRLLWKTEAALLLSGAAYWLKLANTRRVKSLQWLNPFTMKVTHKTGQNNEVALSFQQTNVENPGAWSEDEIVYFREFNPGDDIGPGVCSAGVAIGDAQAMRYITRFAGYFFEGGAMPMTILSVEGGIGEDESKRMESFFKRSMTGVRNAWRVLAVRNSVDPKVITPDLKDMAMPELAEEARHNVALAFGIPTTMLSDAANYATAEAHRASFWQDTVRPRGMLLEEVINSQLLDGMKLELKLGFDELDIFQEDEADRASSLQQLSIAGVPLLMAMDILGYDITDEQRAELEQEIIPETSEREPDPLADELSKWERVARKRIGKQKKFESNIIEPAMLDAIQAQIEDAQTVEDVKAIFSSVRTWRDYP